MTQAPTARRALPPLRLAAFLGSALLVLAPASGRASAPDTYGMGAENIATSGGSVAFADDSYAAYYNPAGLGRIKHIRVSAMFLGAQAHLRPFDHIVFDSDFDGRMTDIDGYPDQGRVGTDYNQRNTGRAPFTNFGIQFGVTIPIGKHIGFGLAGYLPGDGILRLEMQDVAMPYYPMFKNRNNRFSLSPGLSIRPWRGIYIGLGAQVMSDAVIVANATLIADVDAFGSDPDSADVSGDIQVVLNHMAMETKGRFAPNFGFLLDFSSFADPDTKAHEILSNFAFGFSYRGTWRVGAATRIGAAVGGEIRFDDDTVLLADILNKPISFEMAGTESFYTPAALAWGLKFGYGPITANAEINWTQWSRWKETGLDHTLLVVNALAGINLAAEIGRDVPPPDFRDSLSFRLGIRGAPIPLAQDPSFGKVGLALRGGYAFVPSPVPDQTGLTNYMDSNRHFISFGAGLITERFGREVDGVFQGISRGPVQVNLGAQFQILERRTVTKDPGLIADSNGDGRADFPAGYPLSGELTSAGFVWAIAAGVSMDFGRPKR